MTAHSSPPHCVSYINTLPLDGVYACKDYSCMMSLEPLCPVRSDSPSFGRRCLAEQFNAPAASVVRYRYMELMSPARVQMVCISFLRQPRICTC